MMFYLTICMKQMHFKPVTMCVTMALNKVSWCPWFIFKRSILLNRFQNQIIVSLVTKLLLFKSLSRFHACLDGQIQSGYSRWVILWTSLKYTNILLKNRPHYDMHFSTHNVWNKQKIDTNILITLILSSLFHITL